MSVAQRDSSFKVVHSLNHASPHLYSSTGAGPASSQLPDDPVRTGVVIIECPHCQKSVILLETKVRKLSKEVGSEEAARTLRTMAWPSESVRTLHQSAPEGVRSPFAEASTCEKAKEIVPPA